MTTLVRRAVVVGSTMALSMSLMAPALADDATEDVAALLTAASEATYTATRLTVSVWGDETQVVRERVEHAEGGEMVLIDETWSMVGNGRMVQMGETPKGMAFVTERTPFATDRYEIGETTKVAHMKRPCTLVEVLEDGDLRAHMVVDDRTGAPLITYVYDGEGRAFRTTSLSQFKPHRTYEWPEGRTDVPLEIVMEGESESLPTEVAGYTLVDAFPGPAGSDQGFYTDGLFSYSLFALPAGTVVEGFGDPSTFVADAGVYEIVPTAKDVRVQWTTGDHQMVLVGDLPPDHLTEVLATLPQPDNRSMLAKWWSRLFG